MPKTKPNFVDFIRLIIDGDIDEVSRHIAANPSLANMPAEEGASRENAANYFFSEISHYLYAGDTPLHMAAAAFQKPIAKLLIANGANCREKNRRGAEPLHYAADNHHWNPKAQSETIEYLIAIGADANALDKSGVTPLHRAVRSRSAPAVQALLNGGAIATKPNKNGSTPLHLAVQTTGASGSGSEHARQQQAEIIKLLLARGAKPTDKDGQGKQVREATKSEWIQALLNGKSGDPPSDYKTSKKR